MSESAEAPILPASERRESALPEPGTPEERVLKVAVEAIVPNPRQPRRQFRQELIRDLSQSIQSQGVIQPLVVRPAPGTPGQYELVAGERRLRAVRLLGWATVPVLVRHIADEHLLEAALVENLQREQLTPVEEALAYRALLDQYGYTQESLSQRVGKDRSTIANTVRLLALPQAVQQDLEEGRLSAGHARALLAVSDPARQIGIRNVILAKGLNVRETESLVNRQRPSATPSVKPSLPQREEVLFQSAQDTLERQLATRVIIRRAPGTQGEGAGKIEIEYYSLEDFNRLYERLNRS